MKPLTILLLLVAGGICGPAVAQDALPASPASLIERSSAWDGGRFLFQGELIGEPLLVDPSGFWVNLSEEGTAIGVFCPASLSLDPKGLQGGRYGRTGDRIEVEGTLHRLCPEHGGELDLHARTLRVLTPAHDLENANPAGMLTRFIGWMTACFLVFLSFLYRSRGEEPKPS
jgi:hypothetical protein